MIAKLSLVPNTAWLGGLFCLLLISHFFWCRFVAYPVSFERKLRTGRSWVYIPLRWRGFHKLQVRFFSRLLILGISGTGTVLLVHETGKREPIWITGFAAGFLILISRLDVLWTYLRYRQQEDAYYLLHDELRTKLEQEGKDLTDTQVRSLAAYQHQQRLRKADETGKLIIAMGQEAKRSRQSPKTQEPVET